MACGCGPCQCRDRRPSRIAASRPQKKLASHQRGRVHRSRSIFAFSCASRSWPGCGISLAAWLRFDRGAYLWSVGAVLASLALFWAAAWIATEDLRRARDVARREARRGGLRAPALEFEWQEFAQRVRSHAAAELADTVRRGPLRNGVSVFPASYFWLGTLGLLFAPDTVVPDAIPVGAREASTDVHPEVHETV